jgi:hypothetical protein
VAFVEIVTIPGVTADQYDMAMEMAYGGSSPDGEILHVAGENESDGG